MWHAVGDALSNVVSVVVVLYILLTLTNIAGTLSTISAKMDVQEESSTLAALMATMKNKAEKKPIGFTR